VYFNPQAVPAELPALARRVIAITGWQPWADRLRSFNEQIKKNPIIEEYFAGRYMLEIALGRLFDRVRRNQKLGLPKTYEETTACSFIAMAARVHHRLSAVGRTRLSGMIRDGLQAEHGLTSVEHEMAIAAHLMARGFDVQFPDIEQSGRFDILASREGLELEVEAKTLSGDIGRKIHRRRLYQLAGRVLPAMDRALKQGTGGQLARVILPSRLFGTDEQMRDITACVTKVLESGISFLGPNPCAIELIRFPLKDSPFRRSYPDDLVPYAARQLVERLTGTSNGNVSLIVDPDRSAVVVAIESRERDGVMNGIVESLKKAVQNQFTGKRPAVFCVRFSDILQSQLLELAEQDQSGTPSALQIATSMLLDRSDWRHIHTLAYITPGEVAALSTTTGQVLRRSVREQGRPYVFKNRHHPLVDDPRSNVF
jgi:hypothetical protein